MDAATAKKLALKNKENIDTSLEIKKEDLFSSEVKLLHGHFKVKIEEAVKKGHLSTDPIKFDGDRFSLDVVREVNALLKLEGYSLQKEHHNAYNKVTFQISWV